MRNSCNKKLVRLDLVCTGEQGGVLLEYFILTGLLVVSVLLALPQFGNTVSNRYLGAAEVLEDCNRVGSIQGPVRLGCVTFDQRAG